MDTVAVLRHDVASSSSACHYCLRLHQAQFRIPPWHSVLLASRLIHMLKTDLEYGVMEREVSAVQWRHEAVMERSVISNGVSCDRRHALVNPLL